MKLKSILAGTFKLDGGAMFGVVPKMIWNKLIDCDDQNRCTWAMRCLYIEEDKYKILIDTGMGTKQNEKFFSHYQPSGNQDVRHALTAAGVDPSTITDVLFSHLHFDHCGGAIAKDLEGNLSLVFPNARHWVHQSQWDLANTPNAREKASFLKENFTLLESHLQWILPHSSQFPFIEFIQVDGHTTGMVVPLIQIPGGKKLLYCADLFPSIHHLPLPYVIAYDTQPLVTLREKEKVLSRAVQESIALFFEHDVDHEVATVSRNEYGKYLVQSKLSLEVWLIKSE